MLIPVKTQERTVSIEVIVNGTPSWSYEYEEDQHYKNDSGMNDPKFHDLGFPHDLKVLRHDWRFVLLNPSSSHIKVDVGIIWHQERDGQKVKIQEWKIEGHDIPPNSPDEFSSFAYVSKS